ncbi:MAG: gliding motility lipoprotein GldD [Bacteroidales bacterium]|nr:gliding motility lipoprotein GldD [Bacteroidales bacterium]
MKKTIVILSFILSAVAVALVGCRNQAVPKPRGFFRIDLPEKKYINYNSEAINGTSLPLFFEYPAYGRIVREEEFKPEPGWFNIEFPEYNARIHLTYKTIKNDLPSLIEETYQMNIKNHIVKADAINEQVISDDSKRIYGILYDLKGNTATSVQFYVTDSTKNYLRGSLYFSAEPNADSLAPLISFFREDIVHLIETLKWKE